MVGEATGRHREILEHDGSSAIFAKNKSQKGKSPGEERKTKWRKSVYPQVCLDNRGRCYRRIHNGMVFGFRPESRSSSTGFPIQYLKARISEEQRQEYGRLVANPFGR